MQMRGQDEARKYGLYPSIRARVIFSSSSNQRLAARIPIEHIVRVWRPYFVYRPPHNVRLKQFSTPLSWLFNLGGYHGENVFFLCYLPQHSSSKGRLWHLNRLGGRRGK